MYIITYNQKWINGVYLQIQWILDYLCRNVSKTISVPVYLCRVEALRKILTPQVQQVSSPLLAILRAFERKKKSCASCQDSWTKRIVGSGRAYLDRDCQQKNEG